MAELVGAELSLPVGDDSHTEYVRGSVLKYNLPTTRYPAGRLSVRLKTPEANLIYLPLDEYQPSMLVAGTARPHGGEDEGDGDEEEDDDDDSGDEPSLAPAAAGATAKATPRPASATPGMASVVGSLGSPPTTPYYLRSRPSAGVSSAAGPARRSERHHHPSGATGPQEAVAAHDTDHAQAADAGGTGVRSTVMSLKLVGAKAKGATPESDRAGAAAGGTPSGTLTSPQRRGRPPGSASGKQQAASPAHAGTAKSHHDAAGQAPQQPLASSDRMRYALNFVLLVAVAVPAVVYGVVLCTGGCHKQQLEGRLVGLWGIKEPLDLVRKSFWCALGNQRPVAAVMAVFTLNVDVLFWIISLLQGSTWLIDPYWTIIPPLIGLFYQHVPSAVTNVWRSRVVMGLLWVWSVRLTHSYFRREEWQLGAREDWRYAGLKQSAGRHWWWVSFLSVYVAQQLMLVGVTLPVWAVHSSDLAWGLLDTVATVAAVTGLLIAYFADTQLRSFMVANERRRAAGQPPLLVLDTGLWRYSRHPNYFGEQLWWWSVALFGLRVGQGWTAIGTFFNSFALVEITRMTEARMLRNPVRVAAFRHYQATTSTWVPWPVRST